MAIDQGGATALLPKIASPPNPAIRPQNLSPQFFNSLSPSAQTIVSGTPVRPQNWAGRLFAGRTAYNKWPKYFPFLNTPHGEINTESGYTLTPGDWQHEYTHAITTNLPGNVAGMAYKLANQGQREYYRSQYGGGVSYDANRASELAAMAVQLSGGVYGQLPPNMRPAYTSMFNMRGTLESLGITAEPRGNLGTSAFSRMLPDTTESRRMFLLGG